MSNLVTRVVFVVACCFASAAFGQQRTPLVNAEFDGVVVSPGPQGIIFKQASGATMMASIDPARSHNGQSATQIPPAKVSIKGTLRKDQLYRGRLVQLSGFVERKKRLAEPIKEITLISNASTNPPGVFDATPPGAFDAPEPKAGVEYKSIIGQIANVRGDTISIQAGRMDMVGTLAGDVKVFLDSSDLSDAQPGDPIHVAGYPLGADFVFATEITIDRKPGESAAKPEIATAEGRGLFAAPAAGPTEPKAPAGERVRGKILRLN